MKAFSTIILLVLIFSNFLRADWKRVYRYNETMGMEQWDMSCCDSLNCVSVGNAGIKTTILLRTTDGGFTWFEQYVDAQTEIRNEKGQVIDVLPAKFNKIQSVEFVTPNFTVMGHREGQISISHDGGITFEGKKFDTERDIKSIHFVNESYGIVFAYEDIYRTYDGGENWEKIELSYKKNISTYEANISVVGKDSFALIVYDRTDKDNKFYQTIITGDGGTTWIKGEKIPQYDEWKPYFLTLENGWIAGAIKSGQQYKQVIYHTTDGGQNWQLQLDTIMQSRPQGLFGIYFANDEEGIAYGQHGILWRTSDGGENWEFDPSFPIEGSDGFQKLVFPKGDINKILANVYIYGEIWLYDENLSASDSKILNIDIIPNPATNFISLSDIASVPGERIEIYSQLGVKVLEASVDEGQLDVSALSPGVYFIRCGGRIGKFVKIAN